MLDTVGAEMQVVNKKETSITLKAEDKVILTPDQGQEATSEILPINFAGLAKVAVFIIHAFRFVIQRKELNLHYSHSPLLQLEFVYSIIWNCLLLSKLCHYVSIITTCACISTTSAAHTFIRSG